MLALAYSFPTLRKTPAEMFAPFDAEAFARCWAPGSGGEKDAALFVLSVWNPETDWREIGLLARDDGPTGGRFDVHRALGNWDNEHARAFLAWAAAPWWP